MSKHHFQNPVDNLKNLRIFGIIWGIIFLFIAYKINWNAIPIILAILFLAISILKPKFFEYTKIMPLWIKFGEKIGKINSKIIIFAMFYLLFTPIGILLRIMGKDLLSKKLQPLEKTYFKPRIQPSTDLKNQF